MSNASLLFPATRYAEVGPFRFPIHEALFPGETREFHALNQKQTASTYKSVKFAQKLAKEMGKPAKEVLEMLASASQGENEELFFNHASDLLELQEGSLSAEDLKYQYAFKFIQSRGEFKLPGEDAWRPGTEWTEEDMDRTPIPLIEGIYKILVCERDGWPSDEDDEDAEGNAPKAKRALKKS
jgi:hypothetical protein